MIELRDVLLWVTKAGIMQAKEPSNRPHACRVLLVDMGNGICFGGLKSSRPWKNSLVAQPFTKIN